MDFDKVVVLGIVFTIVSCWGLTSAYYNKKNDYMLAAIEQGADPIAVKCAFNSINGDIALTALCSGYINNINKNGPSIDAK